MPAQLGLRWVVINCCRDQRDTPEKAPEGDTHVC